RSEVKAVHSNHEAGAERSGFRLLGAELLSSPACGYVSELIIAYKDGLTNSVWISILEVNDLCTGQRFAISNNLCRCSADSSRISVIRISIRSSIAAGCSQLTQSLA